MATAEENNFQEDVKNLSIIFNEGLDLFNNLGRSDEHTNSFAVQTNVKKCIKIFENATKLVSYAGIFSRNEGIEEVATSDLQYFLLPALLGTLNLKLTSGDRRNIVEVTEIYFKDFMTRCNEYNLSNYEFKEQPVNDSKEPKEPPKEFTEVEEITAIAKRRAFKISRYREQQELKKRLGELKENMVNNHADEEIKRKYFLTMIELYIYEAIDELGSLDMEKPLLDYMDKMKKDDKPKLKKRPPPPLRPVIITKDQLQKAIYGAGYPSLPTMTVQEFYDKRVQDGIFPDPTKPKSGQLSLQEKALAGLTIDETEHETVAIENKLEQDDEDYIQGLRQNDEFKDEHRRGWGNRMNRS